MIRQRALEPYELLDAGSIQRNFGSGLRANAAVALTQGQLCIPTTTSKAHVSMGLADASAAATAQGPIYVAEHGMAASAIGRFNDRAWMLTAQATTGATIGDPVYLSDTAGGWSLTPGTVGRRIGTVIEVHATTGRVLLTPNASMGSGDQGELSVLVARGTIANAALKTLNATPVTVIAAPAAGYFIEVLSCHWWLDYTAPAFDAAAAGDTLDLKYTGAGGAVAVDPVAGDTIGAAAADYHVTVRGALEVIPVVAAVIVAHINTGEWFAAAGASALNYEIEYRVRKLAFTV